MLSLINVLVHIKCLFSKRKNMDSLLCYAKLRIFRGHICLLYPFVHCIHTLMQPLLEDMQGWFSFELRIFQAWVSCGSVGRDTADGSAWHQLSLQHTPVPSSNCPGLVRLHWKAPPLPNAMWGRGAHFCEPGHSEASLLLGGSRLLSQPAPRFKQL